MVFGLPSNLEWVGLYRDETPPLLLEGDHGGVQEVAPASVVELEQLCVGLQHSAWGPFGVRFQVSYTQKGFEEGNLRNGLIFAKRRERVD